MLSVKVLGQASDKEKRPEGLHSKEVKLTVTTNSLASPADLEPASDFESETRLAEKQQQKPIMIQQEVQAQSYSTGPQKRERNSYDTWLT